MHEAAFVENIMKVVSEEAEKYHLKTVKKIRLCAGALSCVAPESLTFYFEFASKTTPLEGAELMIETKPAMARCADCERKFEVGENLLMACPACSSLKIRLVSGYEFYIVDFEGE